LLAVFAKDVDEPVHVGDDELLVAIGGSLLPLRAQDGKPSISQSNCQNGVGEEERMGGTVPARLIVMRDRDIGLDGPEIFANSPFGGSGKLVDFNRVVV
jgi:hypothetical protein